MNIKDVISAVQLVADEETEVLRHPLQAPGDGATKIGTTGDWKLTTSGGGLSYVSDAKWLEMRLEPEVITWPLTIHVATTGSDETGDGTAANPFLSPNAALTLIEGKAIADCEVTVQLADGIYDQNAVTLEMTAPGFGTVQTPAYLAIDGVTCLGTGKLRVKSENLHGAEIEKISVPGTCGIAVARSNGVILDGLLIDKVSATGAGLAILQCNDVKVLNCDITDNNYNNNTSAIYVMEAGNVVITGGHFTRCEAGIYLVGNSKGSVENCVVHSNKRGVQTRHSSYVAVEANVTSGAAENITGVVDQGGDVWRVSRAALTQNELDHTLWVEILGNTGITDGTYEVVATGVDYFDINGAGQVTSGTADGTVKLTNEKWGVYASRASSASTASGHGLTGANGPEGTGSGGYIE